MSVEELLKLLNLSWSKETCNPSFRDKWSEENKSIGQSDVTSIVAYNFYGGKIMKCGEHYYNLVDDNILDLTIDEFMGEKPNYKDSIEVTEAVLFNSNKETNIRNNLLMDNIIKNFLTYKKYKLLDREGNEYLSYDQGSILGNKRTKVYNKTDCKRENNWFSDWFDYDSKVYFASKEDAQQAGYRPCRVCFPKEYEEWKNNKKIKRLKK